MFLSSPSWVTLISGSTWWSPFSINLSYLQNVVGKLSEHPYKTAAEHHHQVDGCGNAERMGFKRQNMPKNTVILKLYICLKYNWENMQLRNLAVLRSHCNIKCDSTHQNIEFKKFIMVSECKMILTLLWSTYRPETAREGRLCRSERLWVEVCRSLFTMSLWNPWTREHDSTISHMLNALQPHLQTKLGRVHAESIKLTRRFPQESCMSIWNVLISWFTCCY